VEAIKARQNNNEEAVAMILEANRQRRLLQREQYLRSQATAQQQLLKIKEGKFVFIQSDTCSCCNVHFLIISLEETEKDIGADNNMDCNQVNGRSKLKRSASEMELDPTYIIDENIYKRSKLAAALIQQPRQQSRSSASFSFSSLTTGATSLTIRKEHFHQYQTIMGGGCSTWEQTPALNPVTVGLPSESIKSLPVLSKKELSILPALNDCSNSGGSGVNSTNNNNSQSVCCSVASGSAPSSASCCWKSGGNGADNSQPLSQSSFESCDSGWMGADDSYDLNTWKNLQSIKLNHNNNNSFENTDVPPPSLHTPPSSSGSYFDATPAPNTSINDTGDIYAQDDFTSANNSSSSVPANASNFSADFPLESSNNSFQDVNIKPDPCCSSSSSSLTWCESFVQQTQSFQQQPPQSQSKLQQSIIQNGSSSRYGLGVCCAMLAAEMRPTPKDCPYDFDCYRMGGPFFRIQRPGNPTSVVVASGRGTTRTTFCNMLPRTASYVQ
jgi:hypothetical protein